VAATELAAGHAAGERAAKNTAVRAAGEIIGKLGSLVLLAVLARKVGDARLGIFVFGLAWTEVAMTPVGLGIDQYLMRQVASTIVVQRLLAAMLGLAVLLAGFGVVAVAITYSLGALVRLAMSMPLLRTRLAWPRMIWPPDVRREIRPSRCDCWLRLWSCSA